LMEELAHTIQTTSLCALGKTAANPLLSTLKHFRAEYEAHIDQRTCPAKVCKGLITFTIDPKACTGCMICARKCPENCISGKKKQPHVIDQTSCIKCGICRDVCTYDAVFVR
jgi:Pyruvate/2-oxoacid:ferredoxin oxidoreductase delta subunit